MSFILHQGSPFPWCGETFIKRAVCVSGSKCENESSSCRGLKSSNTTSWRWVEALSCHRSLVSPEGRPGSSLLSVPIVCSPQYGSPTFLSSFHRHANHHPPPCCPPPIPPTPPCPAATSVRRWAPPWRKYTTAPSPSRFHNSLCIAPCFSSTSVTLSSCLFGSLVVFGNSAWTKVCECFRGFLVVFLVLLLVRIQRHRFWALMGCIGMGLLLLMCFKENVTPQSIEFGAVGW